MLKIGIDASNIRSASVRAGGGLTHLQQLIGALAPGAAGIKGVTIWSSAATLAKLPDRPWIEKRHVSALEAGLMSRVCWQQFVLPRELVRAKCDVLFSPGGTLPTFTPVPAVTISQNLLPFDAIEADRFGRRSWMYWKFRLLRIAQSRSFRRADGVIFLTRYARDYITNRVPVRRYALVPHGIEARFFTAPRLVQSKEHTDATPFRLVYVSIVDVYKHQDVVAHAVASLRKRGLAVRIDYYGPAYQPALERLNRTLRELDPRGQFLVYHGPVAFEAMHGVYRDANAFVFASSCENLPNILLEAMASGLPIACSNRGPMPEVLGEGGVYFDPEQADDIAAAIERLYKDAALRQACAQFSYERAKEYSWGRCARETFGFITAVARDGSA